MSKRKVVFGEDGEAMEQVVEDNLHLNVKAKNTVEMFEALKVPSSNKKKDVKAHKPRDNKDHEPKIAVPKPPQTKKVTVEKPLPPNYTCNACGAVDKHAIYNCPIKIPLKKKKKAESELPPQSCTVYIDGLPFDTDIQKLTEFLTEHNSSTGIKQPRGIHIVPFDDNPKKCKGVAFVTYDTAELAASCITAIHASHLNNRVIKAVPEHQPAPPLHSKPKFIPKQGEVFQKRCFRCGGLHDSLGCSEARVCYRCRGTDHLSFDCPLKRKVEGGGMKEERESY